MCAVRVYRPTSGRSCVPRQQGPASGRRAWPWLPPGGNPGNVWPIRPPRGQPAVWGNRTAAAYDRAPPCHMRLWFAVVRGECWSWSTARTSRVSGENGLRDKLLTLMRSRDASRSRLMRTRRAVVRFVCAFPPVRGPACEQRTVETIGLVLHGTDWSTARTSRVSGTNGRRDTFLTLTALPEAHPSRLMRTRRAVVKVAWVQPRPSCAHARPSRARIPDRGGTWCPQGDSNP